MTNDELEQYIYERTRQFVGAHVLQVVNELLAASTASDKQEAVAGWKLVPVEPTKEMLYAGYGYHYRLETRLGEQKARSDYAELINAAPLANPSDKGAEPVAVVRQIQGRGARLEWLLTDVRGIADGTQLYSAPRPAAQDDAPRLDKPAQVSATRFGKGVKWSTVIGAAQRYYEFMQTPEKEALRIASARSFMDELHAAQDDVRDALLKFLDGCAGEGFVVNGIDAAELYVKLFPAEYAAALAPAKKP